MTQNGSARNATNDPVIEEFLTQLQQPIKLVEVLVSRSGDGFELRHFKDAGRDFGELAKLGLDQLRNLSLNTERGDFRPLKCAPSLRSGWICHLRSSTELELALHHLYPGGLADWHHFRKHPESAVDYHAFAGRQTGMFRITAKVQDESLAQVVRSQCSPRFCLKRRVWTARSVQAEPAGEKSSIPCLEPCPMLMEMARRAAKMDLADKTSISFALDELETLKESLTQVASRPAPGIRDADLAAAGNPRRIEFLLEKVRSAWEVARTSNEEKP